MMSVMAFIRRTPGPGIQLPRRLFTEESRSSLFTEKLPNKVCFHKMSKQLSEKRGGLLRVWIAERREFRIQSLRVWDVRILLFPSTLVLGFGQFVIGPDRESPLRWKPPVVALCTDASITGGGSFFTGIPRLTVFGLLNRLYYTSTFCNDASRDVTIT